MTRSFIYTVLFSRILTPLFRIRLILVRKTSITKKDCQVNQVEQEVIVLLLNIILKLVMLDNGWKVMTIMVMLLWYIQKVLMDKKFTHNIILLQGKN